MVSVPVVILAGGRGARFDHETEVLPKPLIEVAGKPILGHIMDLFEAQGFDDFIVLGGYLNEKLAEYLATRYTCRDSPRGYPYITVFGEKGGRVKCHLFDTGVESTTGDRLMKLTEDFMPREDRYFLTYGDGLSDVNLRALLEHHARFSDPEAGRGCPKATVTAVRPPGRFGVIELGSGLGSHSAIVERFGEKPSEGWINGGFMVLDRGFVIMYSPNHERDGVDGYDAVCDAQESFESGAMVRAARDGAMAAFLHTGYWRCMDTRRDLEQIEEDVRLAGGRLPWRRDMMGAQ